MPPLIGVAVSLAVTAAIGSTMVGMVVGTLVSMAASFVFSSLLRPSTPTPQAAQGGGSATSVDNTVSVKQPAAARQLVYGLAHVGGVFGFFHCVENNNRLLIIVLLAGHECESIDEVWFDDIVLPLDGSGNVTATKYVGAAIVRKYLGSPTQQADSRFISLAPGTWTAEHRLAGVCYLAIELIFDARVYQGVPNITATIKGKKCYDPRTGLTAWTRNSALAVADYLVDPTYGMPVSYATGIHQTALIAAANSCDENVSRADGTTEKRYQTDGSITCDRPPEEILGRLLAAMHGKAPYDGETWRIQAGVYQAPTLSFTDDDLRGRVKIQTLTSRKDSFNAVKGTYVGPDNKWQAADFPPLESDAFQALDGGEQVFKDIELPFTSSAARAQRIAKIDLLKARQQIAASLPCKLTAWRCQAGDTVLWTSSRYGWNAKPFEVASVKFAIDADSEGNPTLGIDLELRETAAAVYDWGTSEESTIDPAPNTTLPDPFTVLQANNLTVSEALYVTRDGNGVKARAVLAWTASADAFVAQYQPEYRLSGGSWIKLARTFGLGTTLEDLAPGDYEFRVAAVNYLGTLSTYITTARSIGGLGAPPSGPSNLSIFVSGGWGLLRWAPTADLDVRIGGWAQARFVNVAELPFSFAEGSDLIGETGFTIGAGADWDQASIAVEKIPGADSHATVAVRTGCFLLDFIDSSGQLSGTPAGVLAAQLSTGWSELAAVIEDPGFTGAKTNCSVSGSALLLDSGSATATYAFAGAVNLAALHAVRVTADIEASVVNNDDSFDSAELFDSADSFDQTVSGSEASAWLEMRWSTTDPAASPVWSAWTLVESQEVEAWGVQFRYQMAATDTDYGISTTGLAAVVEERV